MFKNLFKKYYFVELEYVKGEDIYVSHLVCESTKRYIELSGIINNLGPDIDDWKFILITRIDRKDALKLNDTLDKKSK